MGMISSAYIMYGYHLGGNDSDRRFHGVAKDEPLTTSWWDEDDNGNDFLEKIERQLLAMIGFTEMYADGNANYFIREAAARAKLKVCCKQYGAHDYDCANYVLYAVGSEHNISWGAIEVDLMIPDDADKHLAEALAYLGIMPTQTRPSWVLGSFYG